MGLFNNLTSDTNLETKNAIENQSKAIDNQTNAVKDYTGNAGYQNSINQGLQGAAVTANQAGAQAANAGRNAGMTKAQAAAMGAGNAANAYGQNFANQQSNAMNAGLQNVYGKQGITSAYSNLANTNMQAQNAAYGRANQNLGTIRDIAGGVGGMFVGLSDERCKDRIARASSLSKLLEPIDAYIYKYKESAQNKYPNETDDKTHVGPMAQQLEKNPVTSGAVVEDENGVKHVNGQQLALQAIAAISDLSKRVSGLEGEK